MKTGEKIFVYGLFTGLVALLGVAYYNVSKNIGLLKSAVIKLTDLRFNMSKPDLWAVDFIFSFQNKSDIDIEVTGYNFDFMVDGVMIGKVISGTQQYIAANTTSPLSVVAAFNPKQVWKSFLDPKFLETLADYKNVGVSLRGYVSAKHKSLTIQNIPVSYSVKLGDYLGTTTTKS